MTHGPHFKGVDVLRLEIEKQPTGLVNLIPNPDGLQGAWGWVTPLANSLIETGMFSGTFTYSRTTSGASYFYSEFMPVKAGQYAAASVRWAAATGTYARLRFEWLDASYNYISSSTQSALYGDPQNGSNVVLAAQLAPANTAYMRLRFDLYTSGGANPTTSHSIQFREVKVAKAATAGALITTRKNLLTNPSFETNTTGWTARENTIVRTAAAGAPSGSYVGQITTVHYQVAIDAANHTISIEGGQDYTMSGYVKSLDSDMTFYMVTVFGDGNSTAVGYFRGADTPVTTANGWTRLSASGTAPINATTMTFVIVSTGTRATIGHRWQFDALMLEKGLVLGDYFDGSTPASGTKTYSWDGAAHASKSNLVDSTLGSLGVTEWQNILGPTHEIQVDREALNIGTLSADILDATLDPSQSSTLRPGRRVRLMALSNGAWEALFTGKTTQIDVDYEEKAIPPKPPRVQLTAVDATADLAAIRQPGGVGTIGELSYVLEGAGVPWVINGSNAQVQNANIVSINDNATVLDQIAITRDSQLAYAWVGRRGMLNAWNYPPNGLIRNGTFELNATEWVAQGVNSSISRTFAQKRTGTFSLAVSRIGTTGTAIASVTNVQNLPVVAGRTYTLTAWVRSATVARSARAQIVWYKSNFGWLAESVSPSVTTTTSGWTKITYSAVAPADAVMGQPEVHFLNVAAGESHYIDDVEFGVETLDESVYSDLQLSFSSTDCINSVVVKRLTWDTADNTKTVEMVYGPYEDSSSVDQWGRRSAEFTVHGLSEVAIPAYAANILARNANPEVRVDSLEIPIKHESEITTYGLIDLYNLVRVVNDEKGIDQELRVSAISHTITPDRWMVGLKFTHPNSVAAPQVAPPVQNNGTVLDTPMHYYGHVGELVNLANNAVNTTTHHVAAGPTVPAGAKRAYVHMAWSAHAPTNAAVDWQARARLNRSGGWADFVVIDATAHNNSTPAKDLGLSGSRVLDVSQDAGVEIELYVNGANHAGSGSYVVPGYLFWTITFTD